MSDSNDNIVPFDFDGASIRTMVHDGEPMFFASDVASALGFAKPRNAVRHHCKKATAVEIRKVKHNIIPESDIYRLVMRSQLPSAERFKDWICGEVLPQVRKTGGYIPSVGNESPKKIDFLEVLIEEFCELPEEPCYGVGFVYLMKCLDRYKIGFSRNVKNRYSNIQSGNAFKVSLVGFREINAPEFSEAKWLAKYSQHRLHGEWFSRPPCGFKELIDWLQDAPDSFSLSS